MMQHIGIILRMDIKWIQKMVWASIQTKQRIRGRPRKTWRML